MIPRDFCVLAAKLALGPGQASWRSAISRAYYALFHEVLALFTAAGLKIKDRHSIHDKIYQLLDLSDDEDLEVLAEVFRDLLSLRKSADYAIQRESIGSAEEASIHVARAKRALDIASAVGGDVSRVRSIAPKLLAGANALGLRIGG